MSETDPLTLERCCLVVGNARSGSTILGAVLDAHPAIACANESAASFGLWRGCDGQGLILELLDNARSQRKCGRTSAGYSYHIPASAGREAIKVIADKIWNPALLLLHGNAELAPRIEAMLGIPLYFVHAVRNPYDVIATMCRRSGTSAHDRALWYFQHCDAAMALSRRFSDRWLDLHHEDLIRDPQASIGRICAFLGQSAPADYQAACRQRLYARVYRSSARMAWDSVTLGLIERRIGDYPFLQPYQAEASSAVRLSPC